MTEIENIISLIQHKELLVALLAPSFPIMFQYPQIVGKLRRLGFDKVVEVSIGAMATNASLVSAFHQHPDARYITSPCPSVVRLIRKKYPELTGYLMSDTVSPMISTAIQMKETYPQHKPVFIGPCFAKRIEAKEDTHQLNISVITYVEVEGLFRSFSIGEDTADSNAVFDMEEQATRMYPVDGGLTDTSGIRSILKEGEVRVVSGWKNCDVALHEFSTNPSIRLLDILFCDGGCISGPGIASPLSVEDRKQRIFSFQALR